MGPDVVVLGSLNVDLVVELADLPRPGETRLGRGHRRECGGKGANQAVAAARAGARVAMVGAVGDDDDGTMLVSALGAEGVDVAAVRRTGDTGLALIMVADDGENMIAVSPGANAAVGEAEVGAAADRLGPGAILLCQLEVPLPAVLDTLRRARRAGARSVVNPSPVPTGAEDLAATAELLATTDVLVVNETEARALSGVRDTSGHGPRRAAETLRAKGSAAVVVTLGRRGSLVVTADGARSVPAVPVRAVDAVAAGDSFLGVLVCELARGAGIDAAARVGAAAGALAVTRRGAQAAIPNRREIDLLLGSAPPPG